MREEITEPQHWRKKSVASTGRSNRRGSTKTLPADAVDAALADEPAVEGTRTDLPAVDAQTYPELMAALSEQLANLEKQNEQLQKLLAESTRS